MSNEIKAQCKECYRYIGESEIIHKSNNKHTYCLDCAIELGYINPDQNNEKSQTSKTQHMINKMENSLDYKVARKYQSLFLSAMGRDIHFDLTLKRVKRLLQTNKCFFTGVDLNTYNRSVDRFDNRLGYIDSNVVACDIDINQAKSSFERGSLSVETLIQVAKKCEKHLKKQGGLK